VRELDVPGRCDLAVSTAERSARAMCSMSVASIAFPLRLPMGMVRLTAGKDTVSTE